MPAIANVITKEGMTHFVVIFKITEKYIILGDPAKDLIKVPFEEFYKTFTGALLILKPSNDFETGKIKGKSIFVKFMHLLTPHKKLFAYSIVASVILTILGIVSSLFNKILMDEILPYRLKNTLVLVLIIFTTIAVTQTIISFVRQWMMLYLSQKIDIPLMLGYFRHIYNLPMKFFSTRKTGDIITRFSDAFTIKDIFTNIALTLIMDIGMALVTGVILFKMNITLFVIIVMDHGEIAEMGTHEQLIEKGSVYSRLWNMQQGIFIKKDVALNDNVFGEEEEKIPDDLEVSYT